MKLRGDTMNIGEKVKNERLKKGWTQEYVGSLLNVSRSAVSSWEVGRNYPDLETIIAISDLFEIPLDNLLREDTEVVKDVSKKIAMNKYYRLFFRVLSVIVIFCLFSSVFFKVKEGRYLRNLEANGWKPVYANERDKISSEQYELVEGDIDYYVNMGHIKSKLKLITRKEKLVIEIKDKEHIELIISTLNDSMVRESINIRVNERVEISEKGLQNRQLISQQSYDYATDYINKHQKDYQEMIDNSLVKIAEIKK